MRNRKRMVAVWVTVLMGLLFATNAFTGEIEKINIITATAEQLAQLKGIGPSHAAGIIAYRQKNGPFEKPEDLIKVPRIGQKTFEKNKALITVQKPQKQRAKK